MSLIRVSAIILRQFFLLRKNITRICNIFLWITLDVILWGFTTRYLNSVGQATFDFVPVLLGAVILWSFLIRVQQGVILAFFEDMWSRNFLNLFASPLKVNEYILGLIVASITTSSAGFAVMTLIGSFAFGFNILSLGLPLFLFLLVIFLFGLALGIVTTAFVFRFGPAAEWLAWLVPFMLGPFAGVFYPIAALPSSLQPIAKAIPPSYVFEGLRSLVIHGTFSPEKLILGAVLAAAYLVLAYFVFIQMFKIVLKKGLLTRFTSET